MVLGRKSRGSQIGRISFYVDFWTFCLILQLIIIKSYPTNVWGGSIRDPVKKAGVAYKHVSRAYEGSFCDLFKSRIDRYLAVSILCGSRQYNSIHESIFGRDNCRYIIKEVLMVLRTDVT